MGKNKEILNLVNLTKKNEKKSKKYVEWGWIIKILVIAFLMSFSFSFVSEITIPNVNVICGIILIVVFIFLGVIFDIIGVAVTSSDEKIFNSMSSRKVRGAKLAVKFKKNADKVSSFCNDVIGDVCGIISGSAGAIIAISLASALKCNTFIISLIVTSLIAALTIGGKAIGKSIAINRSNIILYRFTKLLSIFIGEK